MSYEDIIDLPHHVSEKHPQMPMRKRAAQFRGFKALAGYDDMFKERFRETQRRRELSDDEKEQLDRAIGQLRQYGHVQPEISVTYFKPDKRKEGGEYLTVRGNFRFLDMAERMRRFIDGTAIHLAHTSEIEFHEE